ncbi:MAG TPA: hypothetical protein VHB21_07280 [Minicystis sp.]|nr:hypothetical protein [Minicystis sp.]
MKNRTPERKKTKTETKTEPRPARPDAPVEQLPTEPTHPHRHEHAVIEPASSGVPHLDPGAIVI